jgi:hypothetical protein
MRHARQRQSQVCGVHGRASPGFGQQLHLQPLSNPHPGWRLISPGRRVVRRVTRCHRPWPGCRAPTNPPSRQTRPSRSRMRSSTVLPDGRGCRARSGYGQRPQGATAGASLTTGFSPGRRGRPPGRALRVRIALLGGWPALGPHGPPHAAHHEAAAACHNSGPCLGPRRDRAGQLVGQLAGSRAHGLGERRRPTSVFRDGQPALLRRAAPPPRRP